MKSAALCLIVAATLCLHGVAAAGVCAGRRDGTLLAAGTCSAVYYQCWKGKPVDTRATTCAKGLAFNPATKPLGCAEYVLFWSSINGRMPASSGLTCAVEELCDCLLKQLERCVYLSLQSWSCGTY
jgi:hypothetical protein